MLSQILNSGVIGHPVDWPDPVYSLIKIKLQLEILKINNDFKEKFVNIILLKI